MNMTHKNGLKVNDGFGNATCLQFQIIPQRIKYRQKKENIEEDFFFEICFEKGFQILGTIPSFKTSDFQKQGLCWVHRPQSSIFQLDTFPTSITHCCWSLYTESMEAKVKDRSEEISVDLRKDIQQFFKTDKNEFNHQQKFENAGFELQWKLHISKDALAGANQKVRSTKSKIMEQLFVSESQSEKKKSEPLQTTQRQTSTGSIKLIAFVVVIFLFLLGGYFGFSKREKAKLSKKRKK